VVSGLYLSWMSIPYSAFAAAQSTLHQSPRSQPPTSNLIGAIQLHHPPLAFFLLHGTLHHTIASSGPSSSNQPRFAYCYQAYYDSQTRFTADCHLLERGYTSSQQASHSCRTPGRSRHCYHFQNCLFRLCFMIVPTLIIHHSAATALVMGEPLPATTTENVSPSATSVLTSHG